MPKLPAFDFPDALRAGGKELGQMHDAYVEAIRNAIGQPPSPVPAREK
jgi:hypothetical protein